MLSRRDIEKELGKGINIYPIIRDNFKENSINLTASQNAWTMGNCTVFYNGEGQFGLEETRQKKKTRTYTKGDSCVFEENGKKHCKYIVLLPHSTTLIETTEVIGVDSYIGGALHSKVGLVSKGIGHIGTMLGPGYCGHLLVALHNITDDVITIKVGSTFVSLAFDYLSTQVIRTSSTISGHLDKFPELGIRIDEGTRSFLTEDWKSNIGCIREKMRESQPYKDYRNHIRNNRWNEFKKYINKRNMFAVIACITVFVVMHFLAVQADIRLGTHKWVDRFWNIGCSGLLGTVLISVFDFLKDRK